MAISADLPFTIPYAYSDVRYEIVDPEYRVSDGELQYRLGFGIALIDNDDDVIANMACTILLAFQLHDASVTEDPEAVEKFAETNVLFMAWPYVREIFSSLASRLELDKLVLGVLRRGSTVPTGITRVTG
ncbi:hypothetical protein G8C93_00720 [Cellulosimicrobium cellulans]|uniref:hypothetical protein n=1 Tax=Cellulosimicrobium cellulans TaxID=1710 RepID=UPI0018840576|nr:hypothetical protein [Cellulosimicrobium cellulans]MBE9924415.1 hypothetical protein [Cellulosimicrobium cellulans]